jgi:Flp pilus assembly pilin Flp
MRAVRRLLRDSKGQASTEYVSLLGTVAIVIVLALGVWGPPLVDAYSHTRAVLISPTP